MEAEAAAVIMGNEISAAVDTAPDEIIHHYHQHDDDVEEEGNNNDDDNVRQGRLTAELTRPTIKCNTIKYNKITRPT